MPRAGQVGRSLLPWELLDLLCPPSTSGLLGRGREQPLSSLFPATCLGGRNDSALSSEGSEPQPERVRGPGLRRWRGMETWLLGSRGEEEAGVQESSSGEEQRTQTPGLSIERETRSPDSSVPG